MARIKYGSVVSSLSGSVGSATFQKSHSGDILRLRPYNKRPGSNIQMQRRSLMLSLQHSWQALTTADRAKWNFFVAFSGQKINRDNNVLISGYNLYLKYQFCRQLYDLALLTSWTYNPLLVYPKVLNCNLIGSYFYIYFDSIADSSKYFFILKLGRSQSLAKQYSASGIRFMPVSYKSDYLFDLSTIYPSIFGSLPSVGNHLSYSIYWFSVINPIITGFQSGVLTVNTI